MKKRPEKFAVPDLLKPFSPKMVSEIRAKLKQTNQPKNVIYCTYDFPGELGKSCAHMTFCFFNFTQDVKILVQLFKKMCRTVCHFIFSTKSILPKLYIQE